MVASNRALWSPPGASRELTVERHPMRKIREVLRMKQKGHSHREITASVGLSEGSFSDYLARAREAGLTWADAETMTDTEVEGRLFALVGRNEPKPRALINFEWVAREMRRTGVTLKLLWVDVLVLDDFLIAPLKDQERRDLLEVLEDRYDKGSTVITTQVPTKSWHESLSDPTIADAICDRVVHNAHVINLRGGSMRKRKAPATEP